MKTYIILAMLALFASASMAQAQVQSPAALVAAALAPSALNGAEEVITAASSKAAQAIDGKTVKANSLKIENKTEVKGSITATNNSVANVGVVDMDNVDLKKADIHNLTKVLGSITSSNGSMVDVGSVNVHGVRAEDLLIDQATTIGGSVRASDGSVVKLGTTRLGR